MHAGISSSVLTVVVVVGLIFCKVRCCRSFLLATCSVDRSPAGSSRTTRVDAGSCLGLINQETKDGMACWEPSSWMVHVVSHIVYWCGKVVHVHSCWPYLKDGRQGCSRVGSSEGSAASQKEKKGSLRCLLQAYEQLFFIFSL